MRSYLVQRGTFKNILKEDVEGMDSLIGFDYMGSAEFEFGALPESLKRIVYNLDCYDRTYIKILDSNGESMVVIANINDMSDEFVLNLMYLAEEKLRVKETVGIKEYLKGYDKNSYRRVDFWWDIQNDFMICFGDENADKIMTSLQNLKSEGFQNRR